MLFINDFSRMTWVTFLKYKSDSFNRFKILKIMVKNEMNAKIKWLRYDRGGEFTYNDFNNFFEENGIKGHLWAARNPQ